MIKEEESSEKSYTIVNETIVLGRIEDKEDSNGKISFKCNNGSSNGIKTKMISDKAKLHKESEVFHCLNRTNMSEASDCRIKTINDYKLQKKDPTGFHQTQLQIRNEDSNSAYGNTNAQWAKLLKHSQSEQYSNNKEKSMKTIEILIALLTVISVLLSVIDNELFAQKTIRYINNYQKTLILHLSDYETIKVIDRRMISQLENGIRIVDIVISFITCLCVILNYKLRKQIQSDSNEEKSMNQYHSTNGLTSNNVSVCVLIRDIVIHSIFYPPKANVLICFNGSSTPFVFSLNTIFLILHIPKLLSLKKAIVNLSKWNNTLSQSICKNNQIAFGLQFVIKCHMRKWGIISYPIKIITILFISSVLLHNFELLTHIDNAIVKNRQSDNDLQNILNCIWLILESMMKISIGDYYPLTFFGYGIVFVSNAIGVSLIVMALSSIHQSCNLTIEERRAYEKLTKLFNRENDENKAVNVVKTLLYLSKLSKQQNDELTRRDYLSQQFILLASLWTNVNFYKNDYAVAHSYSAHVYDLFESMENKINYSINEFNQQLVKLATVDNDLEDLALGQESIQCALKEIKEKEREIRDYVISNNNRLFRNNKRAKMPKPKSLKVLSEISPEIAGRDYRTFFGTTKFPFASPAAFALLNSAENGNGYMENREKKLLNGLAPIQQRLITLDNSKPLKPIRSKKKKVSKIVSNIIKKQKISMTSNIPKKLATNVPKLFIKESNNPLK